MIVYLCSMRWRMDLRHVFAAKLRWWIYCACPRTQLACIASTQRDNGPASRGESGHGSPTSSPSRARRVGLTESIAQVCHREFAVRRDQGRDPVTLTVGGLFEVRDLVRRSVVGR